MEVAFIIIISFLISCIWLDYFKLIDVFENEKAVFIVITFVIGALVPNIIFPIHSFIYEPLGIRDSADPVFSFLFYTFGVGLLEEIVKAIPVLILLRFFKPAINEPLDFIKYICVSALGFAFGENIEYALRYNESVLLGRSVLSVPAHMFFSSIFIYGFLLFKYQERNIISVVYFGVFGFIAHGLYDFLLGVGGAVGVLLTVAFFLLIISVFINIVNNALNNSAFYTPKKAVDQEKIRSRMALFYLITVSSIFLFMAFHREPNSFLAEVVSFLFTDMLILFILIVRLSRLSIIPGLWRPIALEFPLTYKNKQDKDDYTILGLTVKGESYNDYHISILYEEEIMVMPLSSKNGILQKTHTGVIEKKLYLNEEPVYILKLFLDAGKSSFRHFFCVSKKSGITHNANNHPIVSISSPRKDGAKEMVFHEWVVLKKIV